MIGYYVIQTVNLDFRVLPINSLGIIASKFEEETDVAGCSKINDFFKSKPSSATSKESSPNSGQAVNSQNRANTEAVIPSISGSSKAAGSSSTLPDASDHGEKKSATVTSNDLTTNNQGLSTPKKGAGNERAPFFAFVVSAPKPVSPLKSPGKSVNPIASDNLIQSGTTDIPGLNVDELCPSMVKECEKCGKKMAEWDYDSHMDYHFAKELSRELNGLPAVDLAGNSEPIKKKSEVGSNRLTLKRPRGKGASSNPSGSKRGRPTKPTDVSQATTPRTLDSYFGGKS